MELKKLIKNTSYLAGTKVVQFITGIVRSKINAIILGTTGVGIVNQLNFITNKIGQFTMLSMSEAVVKQIAENNDKENVKEIVSASLKSYIVLVFTFMFVSIFLLYIFAENLTIYVFGATKYQKIFYLAIFTLPILILNSIPFAILKGFKDIKAISLARVGIIIVNLVVFVPLVLLYHLKGAVVFVPLSYIVTLAFNYLLTRKYHLKRLGISFIGILKTKFNKNFVKELLFFSGFGLFVGTYSIISEFICRSIVVKNLGVNGIGLYSPIITWAGLFTGFIIPSFSTYLYPRFAETKTNKEIEGILNDAIRLSTFLLIPLLFLAIPFRFFFIRLLYSKEFIGSGEYLPYHFIGVIFYVWWYIFTQSMTPTGRIKKHATFYTMYMTLDIIVTYVTVPIWGLYGWMLRAIVSPIVFFFVYFFYWRKSIQFKIEKANFIIMIYLLGGSLFLLFVNSINGNVSYILGPILFFLTAFFLKKDEKKFFIDKIYNSMNLLKRNKDQ